MSLRKNGVSHLYSTKHVYHSQATLLAENVYKMTELLNLFRAPTSLRTLN